MLIAKKLRKDNIAEYLIYMWQVEDLLRANKLDMGKIKENIVDHFDQSELVQKEITEWYESLIDMMRREDVTEKGHLAMNNNIIMSLTDLHVQLLKSPKHADYSAMYYQTLPYIVELRAKSDNKSIPELETCFSALYGFLLMKLQGREISGETQAAISKISNLVRLLSSKFKQDQDNELEL